MSNLVIVAIPEEDDRVWKISSEKIPHLTLLFLGDADKVQNLESIIGFVAHATTMSLRRFYLPVDRRGELGEDSSDVLFFKKGYDYQAVHNFRANLLKDTNIRTAYDSATQFEGPWVSHLALGYPENPAKEEEHDYGGIYNVAFNKIAIWVDDYAGPEFLLTDKWDEYESSGDYDPSCVAMSTFDEVVLNHHGVKGMRWGVTKNKVGSVSKSVSRAANSTSGKVGSVARKTTTFVKDVQFENKTENGKARNEVINKARTPFKKEDLPAIKARHIEGSKLKTRALKPLSSEAKAYRKDAREVYIKRLETTANATTNASGTRQYTIRERSVDLPAEGGALPKSKVYWDISSRDIVHVSEENFSTVELVFDADGWIVDLDSINSEDAVTQSIELGSNYLAHYGIIGMRWGHHKAVPEAVAPSASSVVPHGDKRKTKLKVEGGENHPAHNDAIKVAEARAKLSKSGTAALSNNELQEVARRLQLEQQVQSLTASAGKKFVANLIKSQGQQSVERVIRRKATAKGF